MECTDVLDPPPPYELRRDKPGKARQPPKDGLSRRSAKHGGGAKKSSKSVCETLLEPKKISGTVLLSHSQLYSTIAAGVLNYRVREGNVCCYPAMSTGKKHNKEKVFRNNPEEMRRTRIES